MLEAMVFGVVLPLATAGVLYGATFAAATRLLRATRTWPRVHERLVAVVGLNAFASTLALLYVFFLLAVGFWSRFL